MALVLSKKVSAQVPSSTEEDDLVHRSSKKINKGASSNKDEEWLKLGGEGKRQRAFEPSFVEKPQGINKNGKDDGNSDSKNEMSDDTMSDKAQHESDKEDSKPLCKIREDPNCNFPTFSFSKKMKKRLYKA